MNKSAQRRVASIIALFLFGFYVCWNLWWICHSRVPPAILLSATGVPAPTTGGTRSFIAFASGDLRASLQHNVATLPIIALLAMTLVFVARRGTAPRWISRLWVQILTFAFLAKVTAAIVLVK